MTDELAIKIILAQMICTNYIDFTCDDCPFWNEEHGCIVGHYFAFIRDAVEVIKKKYGIKRS